MNLDEKDLKIELQKTQLIQCRRTASIENARVSRQTEALARITRQLTVAQGRNAALQDQLDKLANAMAGTIYLLRSSPHNEDYLVSEGYATDDEGIKAIAIRYCSYVDDIPEDKLTVSVDHRQAQVLVTWRDFDDSLTSRTLTLVTIEYVWKNQEEKRCLNPAPESA